MNFSATIRQVGQVSVVEVSGKLTSFESGALRSSIAKLLKEGRKQILLNLSALTYLDSSGIGELVQTYMSVIKGGGEMKVVGLSDKVEEILKITQLYQVFQEFQDEQAALRSFPDNGGKRKAMLEIVRPNKN
ncbi:MAG: anti-sigma-factor antagonist [Candidatus Acidoferrum typicum]|nr:anti-sigma-factor antagonist [Candidatus Acidoferrum typicum]